jgi:hypothetical protein
MFANTVPASSLQLIGAGCFGLILGWYLYFINRYRSGPVDFGDITSMLTAIGGAGVLALFPSGSDLFGAYGIGLAVGFFLYYAILNTMVARSPNFDSDFFLDGRRKKLQPDSFIPEGWRGAVSSGMDQTFQAGGPVNPPPNPGGPAGPR